MSGIESRGEKGWRAGAVSRVVVRRVGARERCLCAAGVCAQRVFVRRGVVRSGCLFTQIFKLRLRRRGKLSAVRSGRLFT